MTNNFLLVFSILSLVNVMFSTARSIITIKCGKFLASIVSALYFSYYNIVLIFTVADFPLWQKCVITFVANAIGVFVVKFSEEKMQRESLWKIEGTVRKEHTTALHEELKALNIPHNFIENIGKHTVFNIYAETCKDSILVKEVLQRHDAKYFASETKIL